MSLNIKNPENHKLAHHLAALKGETLASTITISLRERLAKLNSETNTAAQLLELGEVMSARFKAQLTSQSIDELLYDEMGLPK
jgi:antitoxin VapB